MILEIPKTLTAEKAAEWMMLGNDKIEGNTDDL